MSEPNSTKNTFLDRRLNIEYKLSFAIVFLAAFVSAAGLACPHHIYKTEEMIASTVPTDAFILIAGIPVFLASLILSLKKKLSGLLSWPGMLLFFIYVYFPYTLAVPFGILFLPYSAIVALGIYTLASQLTAINSEAVSAGLAGRVPSKTSGIILAFLGLFVIIRQSALIISAAFSKKAVDIQEIALWMDDLIIMCPALLVSAYSLIRRRPLGYMTGAGLLLSYGMLSVGLLPLVIHESVSSGSLIDIPTVVTLLIMASICLIPFALFMQGCRNATLQKPQR